MEYVVIIEKGEDSWGAYVPDLPGCVAVADSAEEAELLIRAAIPDHLELLRQSGEPLPDAKSHAKVLEIAA